MSAMKQALFSVLVAGAVSCLPLVLRLASFLWVPGSLINAFLFGVRAQMTAPSWLRVVSNMIMWSPAAIFWFSPPEVGTEQSSPADPKRGQGLVHILDRFADSMAADCATFRYGFRWRP